MGWDGRVASPSLWSFRPCAISSLRRAWAATVLAPLTDAAGLTALHSIRSSAGSLGASSNVFVVGVGGLGHLAVQLLRATGASVVAIDVRAEGRELAVRMGADVVAASVEKKASAILRRRGG